MFGERFEREISKARVVYLNIKSTSLAIHGGKDRGIKREVSSASQRKSRLFNRITG